MASSALPMGEEAVEAATAAPAPGEMPDDSRPTREALLATATCRPR